MSSVSPTSMPANSTPTNYLPSDAELQFMRNAANERLLNSPTNPGEIYQLPNQPTDGYSNPDEAALAIGDSLHAYTERSGHEAGAWITSREIEGQQRFFVVADTSGTGAELDYPTAKNELEVFLASSSENWSTVAHIHSHPQTIEVSNAAGQTQIGVVQEGPSWGDFGNWVDAETTFGMTQGYVVSGDGDVYRLDNIFDKGKANRTLQEFKLAQSGIFNQDDLPQLTRIGDVAPEIPDSPLQPNLYRTDPTTNQSQQVLPPHAVKL